MTTEAAIFADFRTTPYSHQLREFEISAELPSRALLWQMRTGKTKVIIDTACHLAKENSLKSTLIIAPNGVHKNWIQREIPIHHWDSVPYQAISWQTAVSGTNHATKPDNIDWWAKIEHMLKVEEITWFAFNSESITRDDVRKLIARIVRRRKCMVVFDESHDFRHPGSKRTKMARALIRKCEYRRILTGTPITNSPLHAFSQFELLQPEALGFRRYGDFEAHYAQYRRQTTKSGRSYPVLDRYINLDELTKKIAKWSSVMTREDCRDLPDLIMRTIQIELTAEQRKLYKDIHTKFTLEVQGQEVSLGENTNRLIKLQQICSGFIFDEYKDIYEISGDNPRLDALSNEVSLSSGKVIVWCQFQKDIDNVVKRLKEDGHKTVEYHGRASQDKRDAAKKAFSPKADNDVKAFIGQPQSAGLGIDLSAADVIIWYSHTFDAIIRGQADERATAIAGRNVQIIDLVAPGIDVYILDTVSRKVSLSKEIVDKGIKSILEKVKL